MGQITRSTEHIYSLMSAFTGTSRSQLTTSLSVECTPSAFTGTSRSQLTTSLSVECTPLTIKGRGSSLYLSVFLDNLNQCLWYCDCE